MCGIIGAINSQNILDNSRFNEALNLMRSRGPDASDQWNDNLCKLGHRRLSILDLSNKGNQPMVSHNKRYVCVLNGEIYNYNDLKKELSKNNINWKSTSDTEVLLEGYSHWGKSLLEKIDGMFAFCIWDRKENQLFGARDRIGEKPLYYHLGDRSFAFASRPTPIFKMLPNLSTELDIQGLRLYLESGYFPFPYTFHKNIKKIPPAHWFTYDSNGLIINEYWSINNYYTNENWNNRSEEDLLDELDELMLDSVTSRMISDVPVGAFLSGGIDSSLVVAMMKKHKNKAIKTFTIGFDEKDYDESETSDATAKFLNTDHICEKLSVDSLLSLFPEFMKNYDEPFFDSAAFPTLAVSKLAKKKVTVVLTGDGGDELFGGYHYYKIARLLNYIDKSPRIIKSLFKFSSNVIPTHNFRLLNAALEFNNTAKAFGFSRSIAKDFFSILDEEVINNTFGLIDLFNNYSMSFPKGLHASDQGMRLDTLCTLNDDYLQKTDVASMSFSLESRAPFLSKNILEWALQLPVKYKIKGYQNKYLLRKLAYRYVPKSIINKPKRGFGVPINHWLRNDLKKWAEEIITNDDYFYNLPINQNAVNELFKLHLSRKRNVHPLLWAILIMLNFNKRLQNI